MWHTEYWLLDSLGSMIRPQDFPQQITELYYMSKEYLRQETIEPAKALGKQAGMGLGAGMLMSFGAFLGTWGIYFALVNQVFEGEWGRVWSKLVTAGVAVIAAALIAWRLSKMKEEKR